MYHGTNSILYKGDNKVIDNILWGALIYIVIGAMIWLQINVCNSIERKTRGNNRVMPFKFLKTVAFWFTRMVVNWPSGEWMCK